MKNADWKIFVSAIAYTLLFYKQEEGVNYLIFSIIIIILAFLQKKENIKNKAWLSVAFGTLISGFFVFYYGTNLPIVAHTISLILLAGFTFKNNASLIISALNSFTSYIFAIPVFVINFIKSKKNKDLPKNKKKSLFKKVVLLLLPLFVVLVFFILYRGSNPLFMKITEDINLDWLSFPLVKFFIGSLLLMYAFFIQNIIKPINNIDDKIEDEIPFIDEEQQEKTFFAKFLSIDSELFTGTALLIMLNLMIALLNAIDINYLWLGSALPQGLVFSDYLHSGTFTLIVSIVFAIGIIIFLFRGVFNFSTKGKLLKILGYIWIVQNIVMIISAMLRNHLYVTDYGFTHKRLGVYIFLLLSIIGLLVSIYKITFKKNLWFLVRKNTWTFYLVLIVATAFNWDMIITRHNIKLANKKFIVDLDKNYLGNLSHVNTYALALQENAETPTDIYYSSLNSRWNTNPLQTKIQKLLDYENRNNWQEKCINKDFNIQELKKLNDMGKIAKLDLYAMYANDITVYETLSNIKGIALQHNRIKNKLTKLENYKQLEIINLSENEITSLDSFPELKKLSHINLQGNRIQDFSILEKATPNLTHLNISNSNILLNEDKFPTLSKLETINLSLNNFDSWNFLAKQKNLKEIIYTESHPDFFSIPFLESLEKINLSSTRITENGQAFFLDSLANCTNLKEINLNFCNLQTPYRLLHKENLRPLFPKLERLSLQNNNLTDNIVYLHRNKNLKYLDISLNKIKNTESLSELINLNELDLSSNSLRNLKGFKKLTSLKILKINKNNFEDINDLLEIQSLSELDFSGNKIKNIDSLYKLKNLKKLSFSNNKIEDISVLLQLKNLTHLSLANNYIKDFSVLYKMKNLKYLAVGNIDLKIIEKIKKELPQTEIDYYSNNLSKIINYNNNKRISFSESF